MKDVDKNNALMAVSRLFEALGIIEPGELLEEIHPIDPLANDDESEESNG